MAAADSTSPQSSPASERRKWVRRLLALLIVFGALPSVVTLTGAQRTVMRIVSPRLTEAVRFESATLHWWAPIQINGLQVTDLSIAESDRTLLAAARLSSREPLWDVLWSHGAGCHFQIERPVVEVVAAGETTNVELTLNQLFGDSEKPESGFPISILVTDGIVRLNGGALDQPELAGSLENLNVSLETSVDGLEQLSVSTGVLSSASVDKTQELVLADSSSDSQAGVNPRIAQVLDSIASDQPVLPDTTPASSSVPPAGSSLRIDMRVTEKGRVIVAEAAQLDLQDIQVLIRSVSPGLHVSGVLDGRIEAVEAAAHEGFAGRVDLQGSDLAIRHASWVAEERVTPGATELHGTILMTADAVLLEDLTLTSDVVTATGQGRVKLRPRDPVEALRAASQSDLSAERRAAVEDAASAMSGVVQIHAVTDLARLSGMIPETLGITDGGSIESGELTADLRVDTQLSQSSDPATLEFDRQLHFFRWQLSVRMSPLEARVTDAGGGAQTIRIPAVIEGAADGTCDLHSFQLRRAGIKGSFGELNVVPENGWWMVEGRMVPSVIQNQLQPLLQQDPFGFTGVLTVSSRLRNRDGVYQLMETSIDSADLSLTSPRLMIDPQRNSLRAVRGQVQLRGRAAAIATLVRPWHDLSWIEVDSDVVVGLTSPGTDTGTVTLHTLISPGPGQPMISDPVSGVLRAGRLDVELTPIADGRFRIEEAQVQIPGLRVHTEGTIDAGGQHVLLELTADVQYDLSQMTDQFLRSTGLQLNGRSRDQFQIRGSPELLTTSVHSRASDSSPLLSVVGVVRWESGEFEGMSIGPGTAQLKLQNGVLSSQPIQTTLAGGSVSVLPRYDLNSNVFELASGSRVERVSMTSDLCQRWMGYVSPFLAESSLVEGQLSARLQEFVYFVDRPQDSRFHGTLDIHSGSAVPGGSLQEIAEAVQLVSRKQVAGRGMTLPAQQIVVRMAEEAVHHSGCEMDFAGWRLVTAGVVGLNEQVQMTVDVPLERSTVVSRGRSLQIPVQGSVRSPQVDLQELLRNAGQQQLQNRLNQEVGRGLNRLLDQLR